MAKGMSMEEFRQALSSDAREENEKLKKELEELKKSSSNEINELKEDLELHKKWCDALVNRCYALTCGNMCEFCGIEYCKYYKEREIKLNIMAEYMAEHKLPKNKKSYLLAEQYAIKKMQEMNIGRE